MVKYSNILILTEDIYGKDFFKGLIEKLKREGYVRSRHNIEYQWLPGKCNPKTTRKLLPKSRYLDRVIVVIDAEGGDKKEAMRYVEIHIPPNLKPKTKYIVFDYCIEEWICKGLGIKLSQHPVESLNDYLRKAKGADHDYEKSMLPDFVEVIDIGRLAADQQFKDFLNCIV